MTEPRLWGTVAVFTSPQQLREAASKSRERGYTRMDALTPHPVEGMDVLLQIKSNSIARFTFAGGLTGAALGFAMQQYSSVFDYPLNVAGRPLFSWPAFVPVTFELTILFAGLSAVISMIVMNRLPDLDHPVFGMKDYERATLDHFFLCILADDPLFSREETRRFLESLEPARVEEVLQ